MKIKRPAYLYYDNAIEHPRTIFDTSQKKKYTSLRLQIALIMTSQTLSPNVAIKMVNKQIIDNCRIL